MFPHIPKRFQGGGMLMPRPFYSRSLGKRLGQLIDNAGRKVFSAIIKVVDGTEQWVSLDSFNEQYGRLLDRLNCMGVDSITCSCVYIDEKLFPGSPAEYLAFNKVIRANAESRGMAYIDMWSLFETEVNVNGWDNSYNKDHFHPNGTGYVLMAKAIAEVINRYEYKNCTSDNRKVSYAR